jgi:hypothetical protein
VSGTVTASQRELIIKQANIVGEDGAGMVEDIEEAAVNNKMLLRTSSR